MRWLQVQRNGIMLTLTRHRPKGYAETMDELGSFSLTAVCAYCGADLAFETDDNEATPTIGEKLTVQVLWDHICLMPPPLISRDKD